MPGKSNIIDLDELLGEPKQVRLGGQVYKLPPDLPVELYLRITKFAQSDATEMEIAEVLHEELLELFRYGDPKLTKLPGLTMSQLVLAVGRIYGEVAAEGDGQSARPPRARGGTTSRGRRTR